MSDGLEDGDLIMFWDEREQDFVYEFPKGRKPDGGLLHGCLGTRREGLGNIHLHDARHTSLALELHRRGYDLRTLRFSIKLKEPRKVK